MMKYHTGCSPYTDLLHAELEAAGCNPLRVGAGLRALCPAHDDRVPSLSVNRGRDGRILVRCFAGCEASAVAATLGLRMADLFEDSHDRRDHRSLKWRGPQRASRGPASAKGLTQAEAERFWVDCLARSRDDDAASADTAAYEYVAARGLADAWEERAFGITPPSETCPGCASSWRDRGFLITLPLYDTGGQVSTLQARSIHSTASPKTLFPKGSHPSGTVFASSTGVDMLRQSTSAHTVLLGEGLTDSLAYSITAPVPALCAPGTGMAAKAAGPWAAGRHIIVAMDGDSAGAKALGVVATRLYEVGARAVSQLVWPLGLTDACAVLEARGTDYLRGVLDDAVRGARHA